MGSEMCIRDRLVVEQYKCQNVAWMVKYVTARKAVNDLLADGF